MKLVMMHEANHPVPAPFNLITWPLTLLGARVLCSPCKKVGYLLAFKCNVINSLEEDNSLSVGVFALTRALSLAVARDKHHPL